MITNRKSLEIVAPATGGELEEAFRLRHRVYALEESFEPLQQDGRETDRFDDYAFHVLVRRPADHVAIGTTRLVFCKQGKLPLQEVFHGELPVDPTSVAEISRFAVVQDSRLVAGSDSDQHIVFANTTLALMRGLYLLSRVSGITHWVALMEPKFIRALRMMGIIWKPVSDLIEHHGKRQVVCGSISEISQGLKARCPDAWRFILTGA